MKSNTAFIDKSMERAGQYASYSSAKNHTEISSRKHKIEKSVCYRMDGNDAIPFFCYVPVLIN